MTDTCPKCGRPAWKPHGGMGGGLMPDREEYCVRADTWHCRAASIGYRAGMARMLELAKEHAESTIVYIGAGEYVPGEVDLTGVEAAFEKEMGR